MAALTLATQPGFTDVDPAHFNTGAAASDVDIKAVNDNAKFGTVRNEQFWGYYKNGETVALPVSPADGYAYTRGELVYTWSWYWTGGAGSACNGTQAPPSRGATSGAGTMLQMGAVVDAVTGAVSTVVSYFKTAQTDTTDGILMVMVHAQRLR